MQKLFSAPQRASHWTQPLRAGLSELDLPALISAFRGNSGQWFGVIRQCWRLRLEFLQAAFG
jgi:hypothetical protein